MGKRNRARTRAIRAEMAKTGDNYARAAAAVGNPLTKTTTNRTDIVREHIRRVLEAQAAADDARFHRAEDLERAGHRIIDGGQVSVDGWEIRDWRTDELIAEGDDGFAGYEAAVARLDPDNTWFHADLLDHDEPLPQVATPGLPPSLGRAIEDWIGQMSTSDEEIAEFIGWSVEKVRDHR
jgi:hypothetical protein